MSWNWIVIKSFWSPRSGKLMAPHPEAADSTAKLIFNNEINRKCRWSSLQRWFQRKLLMRRQTTKEIKEFVNENEKPSPLVSIDKQNYFSVWSNPLSWFKCCCLQPRAVMKSSIMSRIKTSRRELKSDDLKFVSGLLWLYWKLVVKRFERLLLMLIVKLGNSLKISDLTSDNRNGTLTFRSHGMMWSWMSHFIIEMPTYNDFLISYFFILYSQVLIVSFKTEIWYSCEM